MSKYALAALAAAVGMFVANAEVAAQDAAAQTAGGDVTADEATPLPPVVVSAPKESVARRSRPQPQSSAPQAANKAPAGQSEPDAVPFPTGVQDVDAAAAGATTGPSVGIFTLGQLDLIGGSTITNEAMWTYNKLSLDQAVNLMPGVSMSNSGGSRNERDIYVRGFDRFRVPLSIDGVRIYLPADNRLDFNRFLTPDLAEIQVQKGYVSVLNGPGGLGGAINMVSRKPTKAIELEGRTGAVFNGDADDLNLWNSYAFAGTRQDLFYAQVSGNIVDQDHWNLSDDFDPINVLNEDGGDRENSEFRDWRINGKFGFTPNATDEYVVNYTKQEGEKSAPIHTAGQAIPNQRYWQWPQWDISTLSFLSKTQLGSASYVKTNAYYNTFDNLLSSYDDATFGLQTQPFAFDSYYNDEAYGGSVEFGIDLIPMNTLKFASHFRRDIHNEFNINRPDNANPNLAYREPTQTNREDTWSIAVENTFHMTKQLDLVTGASYDWLLVDLAEDWQSGPSANPSAGSIIERETPDADARSYQAALIYSYSNSGKVHASYSDRMRFATVFERYSTRFGTQTPNPDLAPERAQNYEIGIADTLFRNARVSANIFYSELEDSIQSVTYYERVPAPTPMNPAATTISRLTQNQNIGGEYYGFELSGDWDVSRTVRIGGNYTYLERELDYLATTPTARPENTPRHKAFLYLSWAATDKLTLTPSLELASDRNSMITSSRSSLLNPIPNVGDRAFPNYDQLGSYTLLNIQAEYKFNDKTSAAIGATNLLDDNYGLAEGFPEPGRQFFANVRARF